MDHIGHSDPVSGPDLVFNMAQGARVDLKNVNSVRMTCEQATINNLTLDLDMLKPTDREASAPTTSASASGPAPSATTSSFPLKASDHRDDGKYHLLLSASGSVATIKIPNIVQSLARHRNLSIRIILTEAATRFLHGGSREQPTLDQLAQYPNVDAIYRDEDEWKRPWTRGDPILHIELRRWADMLVIAPLSANTLAKISNGLCDNPLTSIVRAWEVLPPPSTPSNDDSSTEDAEAEPASSQKRILVAPAMNTAMWRHPVTATHLQALRHDHGYHWIDMIGPIEKELACGDTGDGAMADWNKIVSVIGVHVEMRKLRLA